MSNAHFARLTMPDYFRDTAEQLKALVRARDIQTVVGVTIHAAEFMDDLPCPTKILDDYDCVTLTLERYREAGQRPRSLARRVAKYVQYLRVRSLEASLTSRFDLVTTISASDRDRLRQLSRRRPEAVRIIKNGVDSGLIESVTEARRFNRAIAFWGNFSFPPNRHAVLHFYRNVFRPHLKNQAVQFHIVGPNATDDIRRLCVDEQDVELAGFVPNLSEYLADVPIMVNPMISGSGLKNKVLEAFAMKKVVVSTSMGAAAIEAVPGTHYVETDEPKQMAEAILDYLSDQARCAAMAAAARRFVLDNYQWSAVGKKLLDLIEECESHAPTATCAPPD